MEILSDATFKGQATFDNNVKFNGSAFAKRLQLENVGIQICGTKYACLVPGTMATTNDIANLQPKSISSLFIGKTPINFDVPADCTKFFIASPYSITSGTSVNGIGNEYMVMTKGFNPMTPVNIDLEARCDSSTNGVWRIIATKSSGFAMSASDGYMLKIFYTTNS